MKRIGDLANEWGVDKRELDYWTMLGWLTPKTSDNGLCRDYDGKEIEEEMKRLVVANAASRHGMPMASLVVIKDSNDFRKRILWGIEEEIAKLNKARDLAIELLVSIVKEEGD